MHKLKDLLTEILASKDNKHYETRAKILLNFIEPGIYIENINWEVIDDFKDKLSKSKYSASTCQAVTALLSSCLSEAYRRGYRQDKPTIGKIKGKKIENRIRYLTEEEENKILVYCYENDPILADIVITGINTGLRISEILSIGSDDVEVKDNYIRVWKNKTDKPRSVPINNKVRKVIDRIKYKYFLNYSYRQIVHKWDKMRRSTSIEDINIHDLRHTFCTRLIQKKVDSVLVMSLAGHTDIATTLQYIHLSNEDLEEAIKLLD